MENTARLLTLQRNALVSIAHGLFGAIDNEFLSDPANPLIVSVNGSYGSGKKIIPDHARLALLGKSARQYNSLHDHDEYWTGRRNGQLVQINFINTEAGRRLFQDKIGGDYARPALRDCYLDAAADKNITPHVLQAFHGQRKHGGINFVHNCSEFEQQPDIEVYLETSLWEPVHKDDKGRLHKNSTLSAMFNQKVDEIAAVYPGEEFWVRYLEITLNNQALLQSSRFADAFAVLKPAKVAAPVYGVDLTYSNSSL